MLNDILKEQYKSSKDNNNVYFVRQSTESASFYDAVFTEKQSPAATTQQPEDPAEAHTKGTPPSTMVEILTMLEQMLPADAVVIELGGGFHQCRSAYAYQRFENYYPLDISYSSTRRYSATFGRASICADASKLPFEDESVDCIFSHTFLEHPLAPDEVVNEIVRVLNPGGIVVHNDAWFCRWWQRYGIVGIKDYGAMSIKEKLITLAARFTELQLVRILPIIVTRLFRELYEPAEAPIDLKYKKLKPNYDLRLYCDEDAAASIDPLDAIRFYESHGFSLVKPLTKKQRLFFPNKYIALTKSKTTKN